MKHSISVACIYIFLVGLVMSTTVLLIKIKLKRLPSVFGFLREMLMILAEIKIMANSKKVQKSLLMENLAML